MLGLSGYVANITPHRLQRSIIHIKESDTMSMKPNIHSTKRAKNKTGQECRRKRHLRVCWFPECQQPQG